MTAKNKHAQPAPGSPAGEPPPPAGPLPVTLSAEEIESLKAAAAKADENWDRFLRASAELDNYRKRVAREKEELTRFATERVISALFPALDSLERALEHSAEGTPLHDGLMQVFKQFQRAFADFGLVEIVAKPGDPFNPEIHEAVSHVESAEHPDGAVIEQLQSGYKLADRLLRPARVAVSKGSPTSEDGSAETQSPERKAQS